METGTKQCFNCKVYKNLTDFDIDNRKYQLKVDMGRCKVCIQCEITKTLADLSCCRFNYDTNKFEVIKFDNKEQVLLYFKEK